MLQGPMYPYFIILLAGISPIGYSFSAEKVLLVPPPVFDSNRLLFAKLGQALANRGHVVTAVVSEDIVDKRRAETPYLRFETFKDQGSRALLQDLQGQHLSKAEKTSWYEKLRVFMTMSGDMAKHCELLLKDRDLVGRLKAAQYSVVIYDPVFLCGSLLAAYVDDRVPTIAFLRWNSYLLDRKATGVPIPPSYVPSMEKEFTDKMTFLQRLQNAVFYSLVPMSSRLLPGSIEVLARKYLGENGTLTGVISSTDLWLYQTDNVLDFPRPSMPNMVQIGGLNVDAVVPLSEELETYVQSSGEDGLIVVSFGSIFNTMSSEKAEIFAAAFARLRQKVVWRHKGEKPTGLGSNTKLLDWLPQNDLLGHPKTRAFITHAGYNGVSEALHHGVPMVCLPLFGDEHGNAARVVARGLGLKFDLSTVTTEQLHQAVLHVLTNNSYRKTATRLSRLHLDQPESPMQRAVWWIEHVIRHGGLPHLRARAVDLPFYQYYLLDVAAFLLASCSAVLGTVWCCCSLVCRKCCGKSVSKPKSE